MDYSGLNMIHHMGHTHRSDSEDEFSLVLTYGGKVILRTMKKTSESNLEMNQDPLKMPTHPTPSAPLAMP